MIFSVYYRSRILIVMIANKMRQVSVSIMRCLLRQPTPETVLSRTNRLIEAAARNCGVTVKWLDSKFLSLSRGGTTYYSTSSNFSFESLTAYWLCGDKFLSSQLLSEAGLPVPPSYKFAADDPVAAFERFATLPMPLVVKPNRGSGGTGVTVNINDLPDFRRAFYGAAARCFDVIAEQFVEGRNWRLTVLCDEVVLAFERLLPQVVGDGRSSIRDLISEYNGNLVYLKGFPMGYPIVVNTSAAQNLAKQGFSLRTVLETGQVAYVHLICSAFLGARTRDVTGLVHPDFCRLGVEAAKALGGKLVGVDIIAEDITTAYTPGNAFINEINSTPGLLTKDIGGKIAAVDGVERIIRNIF